MITILSFIKGLKEIVKTPLYIIILVLFIISWILVMFGYTFDVIDGKIDVEHGTNFLAKPVSAELLLGKMREILDKSE